MESKQQRAIRRGDADVAHEILADIGVSTFYPDRRPSDCYERVRAVLWEIPNLTYRQLVAYLADDFRETRREIERKNTRLKKVFRQVKRDLEIEEECRRVFMGENDVRG